MKTYIDKYRETKLKTREIAVYEIEHSINKWHLYTPEDKRLVFSTLDSIIDYLLAMRDVHYTLCQDVELFDRDKKTRYKEIHRIVVGLENIKEKDNFRKRVRRHRLLAIPKERPVPKIDPRLTRPILREEKTW